MFLVSNELVNWLAYFDNDKTPLNKKQKNIKANDGKQPFKNASRANYLAIERMRLLDGSQIENEPSPVAQFIQQARFMAKFDDIFEFQHTPAQTNSYQDLSDDELRAYFTWRKNVRNGIISYAPSAFVTIYLEELANGIGVSGADETITAMIDFWKMTSVLEPSLNQLFHQFIKDFYVTHPCSLDYITKIVPQFPDDYIDKDLAIYNLLKGNFEETVGYLYSLSSTNIARSAVFRSNRLLFDDCFVASLVSLNSFFKKKDASLSSLLIGRILINKNWHPFQNQLVSLSGSNNDKKRVIINDANTYECSNKTWTVTESTPTPISAFIVESIQQVVEDEIRLIMHSQPVHKTRLELVTTEDSPVVDILKSDSYYEQVKRTVHSQIIKRSIQSENAPKDNSIFSKLRSLIMPANTFSRADNEVYFDYRAIRFIHQARFMAEYEENHAHTEPYDSEITPLYTDLTDEQLHTYFSWRKDIRHRVYRKTSYPYVLIYVSELLNLIEEKDPKQALAKIIDFWLKYRTLDRSIDMVLPDWIRDFYLVYAIKGSYTNVLQKFEDAPKDSSTAIEEIIAHDYTNKIDFFDANSSYHFLNSPYSRSLLFTIDECIPSVMHSIWAYLNKCGLDLNDLLFQKDVIENCWRPFKNGVVEINKFGNDREISITSHASFKYSNGIWSSRTTELNKNAYRIIGYIMRTIESRLRRYTHFTTPLKSDRTSLKKFLVMHPEFEDHILSEKFTDAIYDAVDKYCVAHPSLKNYFDSPSEYNIDIATMAPVDVDLSKLDRIRDAANEIQEKLVIDDVDEEPVTDVSEVVSKEPPDDASNNESLLTSIQRRCITVLLNSNTKMKDIAKLAAEAGGMLPETLLESINETLQDVFSDNIIVTDADEPYIYEDYVEEAKRYGE